MKKILVPVDFSSHTDITCTYALEFAKQEESEILLYHTYYDQIVIADNTFPDTMDMNTMYNEELMKELLHQAEKNLNDLQKKFENKIRQDKLAKVTVKTEVTGGDIEMEIKEVCRIYQPDLVVMGARGEGKNIQAWGRISTLIVNHVKVPVMMIPEIKGFMGFQNAMIAIDLSEENHIMIEKVVDMLCPFNTRFYCVHFLQQTKTRKEEINRFEDLKKHFAKGQKYSTLLFDLVEVEEDNQKAIDTYLEKHDIKLIGFQPHKRSFFYSLFTTKITKKNFFSTNIALIAIPIGN
jgi:nucleotide-binding universal stress UspA family protein